MLFERSTVIKRSTLPKANYRLTAIHIKIPRKFTDLEKVILKFRWKRRDGDQNRKESVWGLFQFCAPATLGLPFLRCPVSPRSVVSPKLHPWYQSGASLSGQVADQAQRWACRRNTDKLSQGTDRPKTRKWMSEWALIIKRVTQRISRVKSWPMRVCVCVCGILCERQTIAMREWDRLW